MVKSQLTHTLSLVSWTVIELECVSIISSSFLASSFLFSGLLRTWSEKHYRMNYQDPQNQLSHLTFQLVNIVLI